MAVAERRYAGRVMGALPPPDARALERVRPPGRRLLRELPHVLRRGHDRALARGGRCPYGEMNATGADMVVAEARIAYRASARFDDELDLVASVVSHGRDVDDHRAARRADAGRRAAGGGRAAPRVRGSGDAAQAVDPGARSAPASSATLAGRRPSRPDAPPADRGSARPGGPRHGDPLRLAVGAQRRAPRGRGPEARRRPDPVRRGARGRQRDHRRPQGARDPALRLDRRGDRGQRHLGLGREPRRRRRRASRRTRWSGRRWSSAPARTPSSR